MATYYRYPRTSTIPFLKQLNARLRVNATSDLSTNVLIPFQRATTRFSLMQIVRET